MIQTKKLTIKNSNLEKLKKKYNWKGSGTETDPVEITSTKDLPDFLKFKTKDLHIKISNIQHRSIKLARCRNFTIYNCRIHGLFLKFCCNITVKNKDIKRIKMKRCYGNIFKRNKISNMGKLKRRDKKEKINQIE